VVDNNFISGDISAFFSDFITKYQEEIKGLVPQAPKEEESKA